MLSIISSCIVSCKGAFSGKDRRALLLMWKAVFFRFSICARATWIKSYTRLSGVRTESESGSGDGRADSIRHSFCSHLIPPGGNFHVGALLSRTPLLRVTGLRHSFILALSYELQSVWLPRWFSDLMTHVVLTSIHNDNYHNSNRKMQEDATVYQILLFHIYMKLNVLRATHRPSSGA
jgi:hypothetical protein